MGVGLAAADLDAAFRAQQGKIMTRAPTSALAPRIVRRPDSVGEGAAPGHSTIGYRQQMQLVDEHGYNYGGDRDGSADEPSPVVRYEMPDQGGCPYLDVDRGFAHWDALVLRALTGHWYPRDTAKSFMRSEVG